jgi:primosomal protein N' (replication factor Y)
MAQQYLCYLSQALRAMVPQAVRDAPTDRGVDRWFYAVAARHGRASQKQALFDYLASHGPQPESHLRQLFPRARPLLQELVREAVVEVRDPPPVFPEPIRPRRHALTADQLRAVNAVLAEPARVWVLDGVTGSGKTEVYLTLIEEYARRGQSALVLVPEIALTPQLVQRFRERFGSAVGVWHSGLSQAERVKTWHAVRLGRLTVMVGARSALFLPFERLGIIVLDEEHEPTYKQEEHPRYHAREIAEWWSRQQGTTVVLGSATPAIETAWRARQGIYGWLRLPQRIPGRGLPVVEVVDMREELRRGHREMFSRTLIRAVSQALARREQVVLFLNRRGYATFVLCRSCGYAVSCPHCAVTLTYHQRGEYLECHYCLYRQPVPQTCPQCHSQAIRYFGAGTERVEQEVGRLWPDAKVMRADRDTLRSKEAYDVLYREFLAGKADVLVGTQMIAKGLDFPRVTVVGIVAADAALHFPDYRSSERTFQLLVQASGRAGRGEQPGCVIIQTYNPDHYVIRWAGSQNYDAFYGEEIEHRQALGYPPFRELWLIEYGGADLPAVREAAELAVRHLSEVKEAGAEILGPAPAPIARVRGEWRYHILLKVPHAGDVSVVLKRLPAIQTVSVTVTRDPYFLL